jgi:hypothetical protein
MPRCFSLLTFPVVVFVLVGCDPPQTLHSPVTPPPTPTAPPLPTPPPSSSTPAAPTTSEGGARDVPEGFTQTPSGLRYKILAPGNGPKPTASNTVVANYRGWLDGGKEFDNGKGIDFPLNGVIGGWTEGLQLIGEGGKLELEIPPKLGYGESGFPPDIPPNAWLHFEVELLQVR